MHGRSREIFFCSRVFFSSLETFFFFEKKSLSRRKKNLLSKTNFSRGCPYKRSSKKRVFWSRWIIAILKLSFALVPVPASYMIIFEIYKKVQKIWSIKIYLSSLGVQTAFCSAVWVVYEEWNRYFATRTENDSFLNSSEDQKYSPSRRSEAHRRGLYFWVLGRVKKFTSFLSFALQTALKITWTGKK